MEIDYYNINNLINSESLSGILRVLIFYLIIMLIIEIIKYTISTIGKYYINKKAGKPGWSAFIPIYNNYILFEISGLEGLYCLLLLIPVVKIVFHIYLCIKLSEAFNKSVAFSLGLIFLNPIFLLILGFDSSKYILDKQKIAA